MRTAITTTRPTPSPSTTRGRRCGTSLDGTFLVCISNLYLELEIWTGDSPWLNLSQLVRAVLLVYYSRRALQKLLLATGFEIVEEFVFEFPLCHEWRGRQEAYFLARPASQPTTEFPLDFFRDQAERRNALNFFTRISEICTENSIELFLQNNSVHEI